jgi:RHS repeat-associated protein
LDLISLGQDALGNASDVHLAYDGAGLLDFVDLPQGRIDLGFSLGRVSSLVAPAAWGGVVTSIDYDGSLPTSVAWSGPLAGSVSWEYDERFLIKKEMVGAAPGTSVTYTYDNDGLVTTAGALAVGREAASGRVTSKRVGNILETLAYNEFGELARQKVERVSASGAPIEALYDVIYDDNDVYGGRDMLGRITRRTEWVVEEDVPSEGARGLISSEYVYGYNQAGRPWLESVAVNGAVVSTYGYDDNGNRKSAGLNRTGLGYSGFDASIVEEDTSYDAADRIEHYGDKTYEVSDLGQLVSVTNDMTGAITTYSYDVMGNLHGVEFAEGRGVEYDIDGAGRRVGRRVYDANNNEVDRKSYIFRDLLRPIAEMDSSGNVVARYVYADGGGVDQNGLSQLKTRLGANPGSALLLAERNVPEYIVTYDVSGAVATYRLVTDHLGSVRLVVNVTDGSIAQRIEYDEFGVVLHDSNPGFQPFGFAGGIYDAETGLVRFGARDYDSTIGRWTSKDPLTWGGGQSNLFGYVSNNPVNAVDSSGLMTNAEVDCAMSVALAAGACAGFLVACPGSAAITAGAGCYVGLFVCAASAAQAAELCRRANDEPDPAPSCDPTVTCCPE